MAMLNMPDARVRTPEAVLTALAADAEHKASLRMFFAAAELCRNYQGVFADETKIERDRRAAEYEKLGVMAEQDRLHHIPAPVASSWHCPSCHATFSSELIVCGKCGFDLRTGQPYHAEVKFPKLPPRLSVGNTKVTGTRRLGRSRRDDENITTWLILGGIVVGLGLLLLLLSIGAHHLTPR